MTPVVAVFCMPEEGHFSLLVPLLADLAGRGVSVHVFTHRRFRDRVGRAGGVFVDLFDRYPIEHADDQSVPVPCRFVTHAAHYAEHVVRDLSALRPAAVFYETFAVIGRVAAARLGLPYINVSPGHNLNPASYLARLATDPRVKISAACRRGVELLRDRHGLGDASPFAYVTGLSPFLNIYCEPPAYLTDVERRVFEPVAFFGCLPTRPPEPDRSEAGNDTIRVYVSFGTTIWRYFASDAARTLEAIANALARRDDVRAIVSLGGAGDDGLARRIARPNVRVASFVDQWRRLADADVFITHHGINSTHEAVFHRVPMLSYPFFWDQPALAEKCQQFGIAASLAPSVRGEITEGRLATALDEVRSGAASRSLDAAWQWEREVIANRGALLQLLDDRFLARART